MDTNEILEEIDGILLRVRTKAYRIEEAAELRLDLSVLLVMLSDGIGDVHEQQGRAEYARKKYEKEQEIVYRSPAGGKRTASDAQAQALIDAEEFYNEENGWKAMYRKLENKRQALLQVCNALSAVGRDLKKDEHDN